MQFIYSIFHFISNVGITREFLCYDGAHLKKEETYNSASNFVNFLNDYILYIGNEH